MAHSGVIDCRCFKRLTTLVLPAVVGHLQPQKLPFPTQMYSDHFLCLAFEKGWEVLRLSVFQKYKEKPKKSICERYHKVSIKHTFVPPSCKHLGDWASPDTRYTCFGVRSSVPMDTKRHIADAAASFTETTKPSPKCFLQIYTKISN
jgi:hypothetical protein